MTLASNVVIRYNGTNITSSCIYHSTNFEAQMNAMPGAAEVLVKDPDRVLSFSTGRELTLEVDGQPLWGGIVTSATRKFAFPVVDTADLNKVSARQWVLRAVDYNTYFDKRVLRNPANYLAHLPHFSRSTFDGALIREALTGSKYFDTPPGFNVTSEVDDIVRPFDPANAGLSGDGAWVQQGSTMRALFEDFAQFSGAVYYFGADKKLYYKALETQEARWGFSDRPNKAPVTASPLQYQGATRGFRDLDASEEGGPATMVNDALVWGGSEWEGEGQVVFARTQSATSQSQHGRWQLAETHFGEDGYKLQSGVTARANVIVNGDPGAVGGNELRGLRFPQWQVRLAWLSRNVPFVSGVRDHLRPGQLVTIESHAFGLVGGNVLQLPLRQLRMSFPALASDGSAHIQFDGFFGLQLSDPYTLWRYLLRSQRRVARTIISTTGASAQIGTLYSNEFAENPNGSRTSFHLIGGLGYIAGTTEIYRNGLLLRRGTDYTESSPSAGEVTFTAAPSSSAELWIRCRIA